jgi:hypothetical protein
MKVLKFGGISVAKLDGVGKARAIVLLQVGVITNENGITHLLSSDQIKKCTAFNAVQN